MKKRNTYQRMALSLLLIFSLGFSFCCHAQVAEVFSHQQQMAVPHHQDAHANVSVCSCGHRQLQDLTKQTISNDLSNYVPPVSVHPGDFTRGLSRSRLVLLSFTGRRVHHAPPLHLLNSVFLN